MDNLRDRALENFRKAKVDGQNIVNNFPQEGSPSVLGKRDLGIGVTEIRPNPDDPYGYSVKIDMAQYNLHVEQGSPVQIYSQNESIDLQSPKYWSINNDGDVFLDPKYSKLSKLTAFLNKHNWPFDKPTFEEVEESKEGKQELDIDKLLPLLNKSRVDFCGFTVPPTVRSMIYDESEGTIMNIAGQTEGGNVAVQIIKRPNGKSFVLETCNIKPRVGEPITYGYKEGFYDRGKIRNPNFRAMCEFLSQRDVEISTENGEYLPIRGLMTLEAVSYDPITFADFGFTEEPTVRLIAALENKTLFQILLKRDKGNAFESVGLNIQKKQGSLFLSNISVSASSESNRQPARYIENVAMDDLKLKEILDKDKAIKDAVARAKRWMEFQNISFKS